MLKKSENIRPTAKLTGFLRREPVLCVSALAAAASCFFVPPTAEYIKYIDFRTIALLYCLMVVVAGLRGAGVFGVMARALCAGAGNGRRLSLALTLMCFFSAMLITNDVALLTFVPFTLAIPGLAGERRLKMGAIVCETLAANMGSMLTPVGNPQNLYLYSFYDMQAGEFFLSTLQVCALSLALILPLCALLPKAPIDRVSEESGGEAVDKKALAVCAALFLLCIITVLRLLEWYILLPVLAAVLLIFDRRLLIKADFLLLLTFVFFFIFVGNVGKIEGVRVALGKILTGREIYVGALLSQVISNVPAAVLLSGFTENARGLLLGVDIGGLGTPVASLASLISLKLYSRSEGAEPGKFMKWFLCANFALLVLLLAAAGLIYG